MLILSSPTPAATGRRKIHGTRIAGDHEPLVLVRRAYSLGANTGNTSSPRVECWIALAEITRTPAVVRRVADEEWRAVLAMRDLALRADDVTAALRRCGYVADDVWPTNLRPLQPGSWPTSIWDRRIILPGDDRWPKSKASKATAAYLRSLIDARNTASDSAILAIDCIIIALCPKNK